MSQAASVMGGSTAYRGGQVLNAPARAAAIGVVIVLHVVVIGGFAVAQLKKPPPPPEQTLEVSFITEAEAAAAPAPLPPQPVEPRPTPPTPQPQVAPQPTLMATPTPTPSPMSAPLAERPAPSEMTVAAAPPSPPQPPAASSATSSAAPAPVTPPSFNAAYLNNPGPVYPTAARMKRQQGVVRMRVQVNAEGAPTQVTLDRTSGFPDLDSAAMDVVRKRWKFVPAKQEGKAIAGTVLVPLEFAITR